MNETSHPADLSRMPRYQALHRQILGMISEAGLAPGDRIPSERDLAQRFCANRMTVRRALEALVAEGVLERNGTSGTRISAPRVTRPIDTHTSLGIARIVQGSGGTPRNRLLHFERRPATAATAARLRVSQGDELVMFSRLWTVNDCPFCIETSHLAAVLVPGLAAEDLMAGQSLYALLRNRHGIVTTHAERLIGVAHATEREAQLLGLEPAAACLLLRLIAFDAADQPIEYVRSLNHPELVVFKTAKAELA